MPEPPAEKALASGGGHKPSKSDFKDPVVFWAEARRGAWKAVYWDNNQFITGSVIDWECPQCEQAICADVSGLRRCPRCGLSVGERPVIREPAPKKIKHKEWKEWINSMLDDE